MRWRAMLLIFGMTMSQPTLADESSLSIKQLLLMPGKVTAAHADLEGDCGNCHVDFDKSRQTGLCLDCHETIASDLAGKSGFHGRVAADGEAECVRCHTDHEGREADIVGLDPDLFAHDRTDFPLTGAHESRACVACHEPGHGYRMEILACTICHEDVHHDRLGDDCESCHATDSWQSSAFDHGSTDFPLQGGHAGLTCGACHHGENLTDASDRCVSCHLGKDAHLGRFGEKCQTCHTDTSWARVHFDHGRDTGFALRGRHGKFQCEACHLDQRPLDLPTACADCHQADDVHGGANGADCAACHEETAWDSVSFDHDRSTDFALLGAHDALSCGACHVAKAEGAASVVGRLCNDCHADDDPHVGELGLQCQSCHGEASWTDGVRFDHDFSQFPLTGSHQSLLCESCHFSADFSNTATSCQSCHAGDDPHEGTLGESCGRCHNTAVWLSWRFDHAETGYNLTGAHDNSACELCHRADWPDPLHPPQRCIDCHEQDDVHRRGFGPDCQHCHTTDSFGELR